MVPKEYPPTMTQSAQTVDNVTGAVTNQDYTTSSAHTSTAYQYNWCPHKLPCGWCSYMSRPCVKDGTQTITWTSTASGTGSTLQTTPTGAVHGGEV